MKPSEGKIYIVSAWNSAGTLVAQISATEITTCRPSGIRMTRKNGDTIEFHGCSVATQEISVTEASHYHDFDPLHPRKAPQQS